jgi:hypothetical protein
LLSHNGAVIPNASPSIKSVRLGICTIVTDLLLSLNCLHAMPDTNTPASSRWLNFAELPPPLVIPENLQGWNQQRESIRTKLKELLGKLPPRPKAPAVKTVSRKEADDFNVRNLSSTTLRGRRSLATSCFPSERTGNAQPSCIATGMEANMTSGRKKCFSQSTLPKNLVPRSRDADSRCLELTRTVLESGTAKVRAVLRKKDRVAK